MANTNVEDVRVWDAPDSTRVVLDVSGSPDYKLFTLNNPHRVVIDLKQTSWLVNKKPDLGHSSIDNLRFAKRNTDDLRIVLDINEPVKPNTFVLAPNQSYGYRLVIDLPLKSPRTDTKDPIVNNSKLHRQKEFVVAIDAGHGGEDPGAVGRHYKTYEKDIVLDVSKRLARKVNSTPGMRAYLVREGDYYIKLRQRIQRARKQGADLFISIHADSFKDSKANGASVYILSEKGESSEAARWLAERENRADLIGGVSLDDKGDILAQVLLDLSQSASKAASYEFGESVLKSLSKVTKLHKRKVQQAGFAVLKSPDIPSILVELGFISNRDGERNLSRSHHRETLANALLDGIRGYMVEKGTPIFQAIQPTTIAKTHKVKAGDSLQEIALKYKTSVVALKAYNQLSSDVIQIGQVLSIPN